MSQCQRKCWRAFPALFLPNYCFTFSKTTEDTLFIMSVWFNDVKMLPGRLLGLHRQCRPWISSVASLPWCYFAAVWSILFSSAQLCSSCRQEKDSKDEVAKAEKELEEIHKVIEESGGKLSNRLLQCDVRLSLFSDFRSAHFFSVKQMKREASAEMIFILSKTILYIQHRGAPSVLLKCLFIVNTVIYSSFFNVTLLHFYKFRD